MTVSRSWSAVVAVLALLFLFTPANPPRAASPPGPYVVTDLGTFGSIQSATANDINDQGQVVGYAASRAFVWQNGQMTQLSTNSSIASAINSLGQVAGSARLVAGGQTHPVLWDNGAQIDLAPGLPLAMSSGSAPNGSSGSTFVTSKCT
jgi:probable HAF family extracellular repeat protein